MVTRHSLLCVVVRLFVTLFVINLCPAMSQQSARYGASVGYDVDMHAAGFAKLTSLGYCCPTDVGSVSGSTMYGGLTYELAPIQSIEKLITLGIALGYQQRSLNTLFAATTYVNDPETNQGRDGVINYTMELHRSDVILDVVPRIAITPAFKIGLGARFGYAVSSALMQREELSDDLKRDGYYFLDPASQQRLPYRNVYDGAIPDVASMSVAVMAGLSYDIRMNALGTTILTPGVWFRFQPSGYSSNVTSRTVDPTTGAVIEQAGSWSVQSFGGSLSLAFASAPTTELDPCQQIVDGRIVPKYCPEGTVLRLDPATGECSCEEITRIDTSIVTIEGVYQLTGGLSDKKALERINVVRSPQITYLPIMYAVSFNDGSSNVDVVNKYIDISPERKKTFMKEKSFARLYQKHLFNVVGSRFADGSLSRITIVGFAHESEPNTEALALERAVKVREHLYRRWGVPLSNITIRAATTEERRTYNGSLPNQYDQRMALLYLNDSARIVDFVQIEDKHISVEPESLQVQVRIELGPTKSVASLDYQVKLGGNTGGKMVQPVRAIFNAGDARFAEAQESWNLVLDGPTSEIAPSLQGLPVGDGAKLIPALRVTSTTGQTIEAERNNATSIVPIRVRELSQASAEPGDSMYVSIALLDLPESSMLMVDQQRSLQQILDRHYRVGVKSSVSARASRAFQSMQSSATTNQDLVNVLMGDPLTQRIEQPWLAPRHDREDPTGVSVFKAASFREAMTK